MTDTVHPGTTALEPGESPELLARNIRVGSRIWSASQAFFFLAFFFAFLYLRALNTAGLWRGWPHHHPNPSLAFGIAILICVLTAAVVARLSIHLGALSWRTATFAALVLVLAAVGLQAAQFSSLGFGPTDAAYASVFVGWTGLFALTLVGTAYWLGTVLGDVSRSGRAPLVVRAAAVDAVSFVLLVLAGVESAAFILLYIVK